MYLGDKGKPNKYSNVRRNYDIVIDNEKLTLQKMMHRLGFYTIVSRGKLKTTEIVYDTEKKLLTGAGLILRKKITPKRTYFSLIRVSSMNNIEAREKKSFLGECELHDQPSDFPVQIADEINKIFNNLFTVDLKEIVKHCTPYIKIDLTGNKYKIISGTGYEATMEFENIKAKDLRTGRKGKTRNFSIKLPQDPHYVREREQILDVVDKYCKEMVFINRNHFEIAEVLVRQPVENKASEERTEEFKKKNKKKQKNEDEDR